MFLCGDVMAQEKKFNIFDRITKLYISKCTDEPLFLKRGLTPSYFKLRAHFYKQDENTLEKILRYLEDKPAKQLMSLTQMYQDAEQYRLYRIKKHNEKEMRSVKIQSAESYSLEDVLNL